MYVNINSYALIFLDLSSSSARHLQKVLAHCDYMHI
jgi:hypothetical protein